MNRRGCLARAQSRLGLLICAIGVLLAACGPAGGTAPAVTVASVVPTATPQIGVATATRGVSSVAQATITRSETASAVATKGADGETYLVGCTPAEVEAFLERFLDAFNRGDAAALRTFFPKAATGHQGMASSEKFMWYSMTDQQADGSKRHFVTYDLPPLWEYFAARHARRETMRLASVYVNHHGQGSIAVGLSLQVYRVADDVLPAAGSPPGQATGKGELNCRDQTLIVVSLGQGRDATPTPSR